MGSAWPGWAIDPDTTASIPVHVYVGAVGTAITADGSRPDVATFYPGYGSAHGYVATVPDPGGRVTVCVYAIDERGHRVEPVARLPSPLSRRTAGPARQVP